MTGLGIRRDAVPAWLALHRAIADLDGPTLCSADPSSWAEPDDPELAEYVAHLCEGCPVIAPCNAFAIANREQSGVWAGRDRTPLRGRPAAPRKEPPCNV